MSLLGDAIFRTTYVIGELSATMDAPSYKDRELFLRTPETLKQDLSTILSYFKEQEIDYAQQTAQSTKVAETSSNWCRGKNTARNRSTWPV